DPITYIGKAAQIGKVKIGDLFANLGKVDGAFPHLDDVIWKDLPKAETPGVTFPHPDDTVLLPHTDALGRPQYYDKITHELLDHQGLPKQDLTAIPKGPDHPLAEIPGRQPAMAGAPAHAAANTAEATAHTTPGSATGHTPGGATDHTPGGAADHTPQNSHTNPGDSSTTPGHNSHDSSSGSGHGPHDPADPGSGHGGDPQDPADPSTAHPAAGSGPGHNGDPTTPHQDPPEKEELPPLPKGGQIPEHTFDHVLKGELKYDRNGNPKVTGYHFRPGGRDLNPHMVRVTRIFEIDHRTGLTRGNVWMRNPRTGSMVMKRAKTTFFPAHWTEKQVRRAMEKAFENGRIVDADSYMWQGEWKGIKFEGYFDPITGDAKTIYPLMP
ncbi:EndoU domain-containing protein, partial [Streptomyces sp. NPDC089915]|uniref:EndoU domain-containing protein n=1 Tax=Streptomyces sp. NPDC089915 TaxID=3155186 RepID=UPI003426EE8F